MSMEIGKTIAIVGGGSLSARGVDVRTGARATSVSDKAVTLAENLPAAIRNEPTRPFKHRSRSPSDRPASTANSKEA